MKPAGMANQPEQDLSSESNCTLTDSGLDLETKNPLGLRSRRSFFLDIPFYRTQNSHKRREAQADFIEPFLPEGERVAKRVREPL
jgi:hypothetical protein